MPAGEADDMLKLFKKSHTVSMIRHQDISARFYWSGILLAGKMIRGIKNQSAPLSFIRRGESCRIARFPTYSINMKFQRGRNLLLSTMVWANMLSKVDMDVDFE